MDGDPPAAMRYTEAKMARLADETLADIDKETVDFRDNYDGTRGTDRTACKIAKLVVKRPTRYRRRHGYQHSAAQP